MNRQKLILYKFSNNCYRAVFKTKHGRIIYLELTITDKDCSITDCCYLDRIRRGRYYAAPQKLKTLSFQYNEMLAVIAAELDRRFYGIEVVYSEVDYDTEKFIQYKLAEMQSKYKFLIFVGEGRITDGLPEVITTRLKNRIHRGIYLRIRRHDNNKGVIEACYYYDRNYKTRTKVIPETLTTVFLDYNREAVIKVVNRELNCDFTDIIFITDNSIDIENNEAALCGNI